jgi:hypothetical protein
MSDLIRHARAGLGITSWERRDQLDAPAGQRATIAGHRLRLLPRRDLRRRRLWICEELSFVFFSFLIVFLIVLCMKAQSLFASRSKEPPPTNVAKRKR